jgi:hypothetical protein
MSRLVMARPAARFRPAVESLEDRRTPTTTRLLLDFTQDAGLPGLSPNFVRGNFADAFRFTDSQGRPLHFLDFNGDGQVDTTDVNLAANAIVADVTNYFAPFLGQHVTVAGIDVTQNTGAGKRAFQAGIRSKTQQVFVIYLGGTEGGDPSVFGRSPQAAAGFNHEGFGRVYPEAFVRTLEAETPNATPGQFAQAVASSVAHEIGHVLGLGHPVDLAQNLDSVMNPARDRGAGDSFVNRPYLAEVFRKPTSTSFIDVMQNPFQELARSFAGQPDESAPRPGRRVTSNTLTQSLERRPEPVRGGSPDAE